MCGGCPTCGCTTYGLIRHSPENCIHALKGELRAAREGREMVRETLTADAKRYRGALEQLMEFGKRLMDSENEDERGIGCCIAEGARVIEPESATSPRQRLSTEDHNA